MADLREFKKTVLEEVAVLNDRVAWPWRASIRKGEIRLTNSYIKGQYEQDFFRIKYNSQEDTEWLVGTDCCGDRFTVRIVGDDAWSDGPLQKCIRTAIRRAEEFFSDRY